MNCAEKGSRGPDVTSILTVYDTHMDHGSVRETVSVLFGWWHTAFYDRLCLSIESGLGTVGNATAGLGGVMVRMGSAEGWS